MTLRFQYLDSKDPIREDLRHAYERAWSRIAGPGTWLSGAERVAIAGETRRALDCRFCEERKAALSPLSVQGTHDHSGVLSDALVDAIHRVTTDVTRLTEAWYGSLIESGVSAETYIEALGVAVITISIDRFHQAMGLHLEELPTPLTGTPTREKSEGVVHGEAWVPMLEAKRVSSLLGMGSIPAPYVIRALSLVPAEVRAWMDVSAVQYVGDQDMMRLDLASRAANRSQIELVAGRVSALNECFY